MFVGLIAISNLTCASQEARIYPQRRTIMLYDNVVSKSYLHGDLLNAIQASLGKLGKTTESVTVEDLGPCLLYTS